MNFRDYTHVDEFVKKTIIKWYKVGSRRGALEMLRALIDEDVIDDDEYEEFIDDFTKLKWKCNLNYINFDEEKAKIKSRGYRINFQNILKRLEK